MMHQAARATLMLVALLLLSACGQQAEKSASTPAPDAAGKTAVTAANRLFDQTAHVVIPPRFDDAGPFSEGLAAVRIGPKNGYIDKTGTFVITPQLMVVDLAAFSEGLAAVRVGEFLSGKWGYMDKQGKMVIDPDFDTAGSFHEGLAVIGVDQRWGYI